MSSDNTGIEWTDATWSPVRGCSRVSEGCKHCYAGVQAARIIAMDRGRGVVEGQGAYDGLLAKGGQWNGKIKTVPKALDEPLRWSKPRKIFVNSMSDLFHENVPEQFIDQIFVVMALSPRHTFQVLTKRPERMMEYCKNFSFERAVESCRGADGVSVILRRSIAELQDIFRLGGRTDYFHPQRDAYPLPNLWLGVSVEDQKTADERIPQLLQTPAAVRWISAEPLLGQLKLDKWFDAWTCSNCYFHGSENDSGPVVCRGCRSEGVYGDDAGENKCLECKDNDFGQSCPECGISHSWSRDYGYKFENPLPKLDWVVVGGESGADARPMHPSWVRSLRDQCAAVGVPFLFKQWGEWTPEDPGETSHKDTAGVLPNGDFRLRSQGYQPPFDSMDRLRAANYVRLDGRTLMHHIGKKRAGRLLDGVLHDGYPVDGGAQ